MPYTVKSPPDTIKNLPVGAIRLWVNAFNAVLGEQGSEDAARMAAWANVKQKYKKDGDTWVRKSDS